MRPSSVAALLIAGAHVVASYTLLDDFGAGIDGPKNYREGRENLSWLLGHPPEREVLAGQNHGALGFMLGDAGRRILSERLEILDPVSARHAVLPPLVAGLAFALFLFVRRHWDAAAGLLAMTLLLTYPRFFGHSFANLKDVPQLVFFSLALMSFAEAWTTRKPFWLYCAFAALGLALSVKLYGLLAPVILAAWLLLRRFLPGEPAGEDRRLPREHLVAGTLLCGVLVALLYAPALWGLDDRGLAFLRWARRLRGDAIADGMRGDFYSLGQFLAASPLPMLLLLPLGIGSAWRRRHERSVGILVLLWLAIPLLVPCLPGVTHYDGMRHFLVFVVPFAVLAALGTSVLAAVVARLALERPQFGRISWLFAGVLAVAWNLHGVATTHPYPTTFFNAAVGGLGGAQQKGIPFACDYWLTSYREAARWLRENARAEKRILAMRTDLMRLYLGEEARVEDLFEAIGQEEGIDDAYVVFVPRSHWRHMAYVPAQAVRKRLRGAHIVHRISRQGGEILTIYETRSKRKLSQPAVAP